MNFGLQSLVSDIAAAMFKVASVVGHPTLKSELENQAISLAASPCPNVIFSAENLINLGRETGDIKPINAVVLVRELESLRKGLLAAPIVVEEVKDDLDISPRFAKSYPSNSDILAPSSAIPDKAGIQNGRVPSLGQSRTATRPSLEPGQVIKRARPSSSRKVFFNPDRVYQYVVGHNEARLKELESAFNEVSGRTIRRTTEALVKAGKIERIGKPGPTSFYIVKPGASIVSSVIPASPSVIPAEAGISPSGGSPVGRQVSSAPNFSENSSLGGDIPQLSYGEAEKVIAL
jgi:hypothetical protein